MQERKKPLEPVRPRGVELIYFYPCPFCDRDVPLVAPVQAGRARCEACGQQFPILPVDERTQHFIKIITHMGRAGINPDFV